MKIIIAVISTFSIALAMGYASLYIEHQNLQSELAQQKDTYEKKLTEQTSACKNAAGNSRLVNPYAQMVTKPSSTSSNTAAVQTEKVDEVSEAQQENIVRTIEQKYSILFSSLSLSSQAQEKMRELLMKRERVLGTSNVGYFTSETDIKANIEKQQVMVANIDHQIAQLLKPEEVKKYELLKDSSYEQYQMNTFYEKLGDSSTLSETKKNTLLLSKLEQKQAFANLLQNSADAIENASSDEKKYMSEKMHDALHSYKDNYLRQAKENLSEEQFNVLREYEQKQFDEIWQSLKAGWQIEE